MNILDIVVLIAMALAAAAGYELGFLARALSWVGLGLGIFVGARLSGPAVKLVGSISPDVKLAIAVAVIAGTALVGQGLGLFVGSRIAKVVARGPIALIDHAAGAVMGLVAVLVIFWLLLPTLANVPGVVARQARTSAIGRAIDSVAPAPPSTLQTLRRLVGSDNFPQVFAGLTASPNVGPPPSLSAISQVTIARAEQSTVKVTGVACNRIQEGSGFAAFGSDLIVTNAHVVAGESQTFVETPNGAREPALVVAFDPNRDVALLSVPSLASVDPSERPLPIGNGTTGMAGAVIGHPGGVNQIVASPFSIAREVEAVGKNLYDTKSTTRNVFILASHLEPGNSGSPLIDAGGQAVGVAFAIAPDQPNTAYALAMSEVRAVYSSSNFHPVSTGPCIQD